MLPVEDGDDWPQLRMAGQSEELKRALGYPYEIPSESYALAGGRALELEAVEVDLSTRLPLLAYGSNAAPLVLARKLGAGADPVPVVRGSLGGFDVVYSAHISAYGAVPATIQRSAGTDVPAFVAYLTADQLNRLSETEPNYELRSISGAALRCDALDLPAEIAAYVSRHGCLLVDGAATALSSIEASGRRFAAMSEARVLEWVRQELCPQRPLEEFIATAVAEPDTRRGWTERLHSAA